MDSRLYNRRGEVIGQRRMAVERRPIGSYQPGAKLTIERFNRPTRYYKLVWTHKRRGWLAVEDETEYKKRTDAADAAQRLAETTGAELVT